MVAAEQSVTSPRFGVRGKIDGVVLARPPAGTMGDDGGERVVALELKSGSMQAEHLGQVAVYRLLVGDLYSESRCADGAMLLYTKTGAFNFHSIHMQILRGVLRNRNHLAALLQRRRDAGTAEGLEGPEGPEPAAPHWPAPLRQACRQSQRRHSTSCMHKGRRNQHPTSGSLSLIILLTQLQMIGAAKLKGKAAPCLHRPASAGGASHAMRALWRMPVWKAAPRTEGKRARSPPPLGSRFICSEPFQTSIVRILPPAPSKKSRLSRGRMWAGPRATGHTDSIHLIYLPTYLSFYLYNGPPGQLRGAGGLQGERRGGHEPGPPRLHGALGEDDRRGGGPDGGGAGPSRSSARGRDLIAPSHTSMPTRNRTRRARANCDRATGERAREQARLWVQDRAARLCKDSEGAAREAPSAAQPGHILYFAGV